MSKSDAPLIRLVPDKYIDLTTYFGALQEGITEKANAVTDAADATASDAPDGGTGAAAGGYDTAANRDLMIASQNALIDDVANLRTQFNALLTSLRDRNFLSD